MLNKNEFSFMRIGFRLFITFALTMTFISGGLVAWFIFTW